MSQTMLFMFGVAVFAITVCATVVYGSFALDRIYQAEAAERPVIRLREPSSSGAAEDQFDAAVSPVATVPE